MFNTLRYARKLKAARFSRDQAKAHIQVIAEILEEDVATKQDLKDLEYRLIVKLSAILGAIIAVAIAVTAALAKVFH